MANRIYVYTFAKQTNKTMTLQIHEYTNMTPTDFNRLKAEQRATYEMAKLIKKRYRATGTGATPQQIVDGKKYLPYTKYTKI